MTFSERIEKAPYNIKLKFLRVMDGLTTQQAADKCGIHKRTYVLTETGQTYPQPLTQEAICKGFDIPKGELFGEVSQ